MKKVLLVGPDFGNKNSFFGGGVGGYTRNMALYLREFSSKKYELIPFYHSVRKKNKLKVISFPLRLFKDIFGFIKSIRSNNPDVVQFLAQYRKALPREFCWCLICIFLRIPYVYDIKAGKFKEENEDRLWHYLLTKFIIKNATLILCQGKIYVEYIDKKFSKESFYFPNFISLDELPPHREKWFNEKAKILFVGYCYEGKGVFELVEAVKKVSEETPVNLIMVGAEHPRFTKWMDIQKENKNFEIDRLGKISHKKVLEIMQECDIYCYPSKHEGEGHNNTINEAMMNEMIIISSKAGFLSDVLKNIGYFISEIKPEDITRQIGRILSNKDEAIARAKKGRKKIENSYNATRLREHLYKLYDQKVF